jgi:hypothetical protein
MLKEALAVLSNSLGKSGFMRSACALEKAGDLEIMRIGIDLIPVTCEQDRSQRRIDRYSVDISVDYNNFVWV